MAPKPAIFAPILLASALLAGCIDDPPPPQPRLGMNLANLNDYATELPFVDIFRTARPWISQRKYDHWADGPPLALDPRGWVTHLEPDCGALTVLCAIDGGHYPSGTYTVLYEGQGTFEFSGSARIKSTQPGRIEIDVEAAMGGILMRLTATNPSDYVRKIRILMPGFEVTHRTDLWNPAFLKRWQGIAALRFGNWLQVPDAALTRWNDRATLDDAAFATRGAPLELMIDLANRLHADPWFCLPYNADDDYHRHFARLVEQQLDPSLKAYVEYSNEVWNTAFPQGGYCLKQGARLQLGKRPKDAAWRYGVLRSLQIFEIWQEVFGGRDRFVRVLSTMASHEHMTSIILTFKDAPQHADVLAIAPYFGPRVVPIGAPSEAEVQTWSLDRLFQHIDDVALPEAIGWMQTHRAAARNHGLQLVAYEAGQHLVGADGAENNGALMRLFHAANADPRMGRAYEKYFAAWTSAGGDLINHFDSVRRWNKYGSWGLLQYADDNPATSPKFSAAIRWAQSRGQAMHP